MSLEYSWNMGQQKAESCLETHYRITQLFLWFFFYWAKRNFRWNHFRKELGYHETDDSYFHYLFQLNATLLIWINGDYYKEPDDHEDNENEQHEGNDCKKN